MRNREVHHRVKRIFLCCVMFILPAGAWALPYSSILAFGDGLSDNGDADGFGIDRFSNGPVWVEYLSDAGHLNAPLLDVAFGGATTGYDNPAAGNPVTGLNWQVDYYLANFSAMVGPDTLVTIWAGANDLFLGRSYTGAASNVELAVLKLASAGFQNFLVMNLPNIGLTPALRGTPAEVGAMLWSRAFNDELAAGLALSQALGLLPENLLIFGIEPAQISNGIGLSPEVSASLPAVVKMISKNLEKKTA